MMTKGRTVSGYSVKKNVDLCSVPHCWRITSLRYFCNAGTVSHRGPTFCISLVVIVSYSYYFTVSSTEGLTATCAAAFELF